jgi:thioesterase superfamily protein 4
MVRTKPIEHEVPSPETIAQFASTWAHSLFSDPSLHPVRIECRDALSTSTFQSFTAKTLATEDTISAWQAFCKNPKSPDGFREMVSILKIGSGVCGHVDTCHGGFIAVLLDEIIGNAAEYERPVDKPVMTAYLNVQYKTPVRTPAVILCRSWVERKEGRKLFGRGSIEDREGTVMATGEALFINVEPLHSLEKL